MNKNAKKIKLNYELFERIETVGKDENNLQKQKNVQEFLMGIQNQKPANSNSFSICKKCRFHESEYFNRNIDAVCEKCYKLCMQNWIYIPIKQVSK